MMSSWKLIQQSCLVLLLFGAWMPIAIRSMPGEPVPADAEGLYQRTRKPVPSDGEGLYQLTRKPVPAGNEEGPVATAYIFGYRSDDGSGTMQHRHEESDGAGVIKGSYGFIDPNGIYRTVNYTADLNGYRAVVRSNEQGFEGQKSGNVVFIADQPIPAPKRRRRKPAV